MMWFFGVLTFVLGHGANLPSVIGEEPSAAATSEASAPEQQTLTDAEETSEGPDDEAALEAEAEEDDIALDLSSFIETHPAESVAWAPTNFGPQDSALGYSASTFAVPKGFESRVAFWTQIYTRYTTQQGLIHDSKYLQIIYDSVDFDDINKNQLLTERQKRKARVALIREKKVKVQNLLAKLQKRSGPEGLSGDELKIWNLFERIPEKSKWSDARSRSRLRFQLGQSDRFLQGLYYSGRYMKTMEKIFQEEGLPLELTRLPFVESSFNILARSKVGASGIWQFMKSTARLYKLKMNPMFDERNDPLRATLAAARVLKGNYRLLGRWPLALTAYNHGPAGVKRAVRQAGSPEIEVVVEKAKSRRFGFASENFYACFLAALEVERNASKYFKNPMVSKPMATETVSLRRNIPYSQFLEIFQGDHLKAQLYNPHLSVRSQRRRSTLSAGTYLHVPQEAAATLEGLNKPN